MFLLHPKASANVERCFFLRVDEYEARRPIKWLLSRVEETISLGFSNEISPTSSKTKWRFYEARLSENGCYKLVSAVEGKVGNFNQYLSRPYVSGIWN